MPTAKKLPSGNYRVRIFDYTDENGKKIYKSFTAPTKKGAELLAAQYKTATQHSDTLLTVKDALDEYINLRRAVLSPSTINSYKSMNNVLNKDYPRFMSMTVKSVKQKDFQGLISDMATKKNPKTVTNYYNLILTISDSFRSFKIVLPKLIKNETYIPTKEEIDKLLELGKECEMELPIMLGCFCMMRRGEICGLSMNDVNFRNKTIHIRHSMVLDEDKEYILKIPKTLKSDRVIKVPDKVLDLIKKQGYITELTPSVITQRFQRLVKKAGITSDCHFHCTRHYAASLYHAQGVPMAYVQKYGGWSNLITLSRIYQHTMLDKEDAVYSQMNKLISG